MKILTLGAGFIAEHLPYEIITERMQAASGYINLFLEQHKPDVIINCIGFTGRPNIDQCEIEKSKTLEANLIIPTLLAIECEKRGIHMIHIGSGCIFMGNSPHTISHYHQHSATSNKYPHKNSVITTDTGWCEIDTANPESFYSKSKYACDLAIGGVSNVCALRIRMPISVKNNSRNLINKLLKYENVLEEPNSVTFIDDLVKVIDWVIKNKKIGIYHITNPTPMTHIQLLEVYRKYRPEHKYNKINKEELQQFIKAPRSNCILNTDKLTNEGFQMTPTIQALENCMKQYIKERA